ncbi:hypothetical protein F0Q45_26705, partial [Mycobacterium simiae]
QAAAGVAGVIKMIQALRHGVLPPTLHVDAPTPHVDWSAGQVRLLTEAQPWQPNHRPRRAGISSFGISGTNAHLIVEEAPAVETADNHTTAGSDAPVTASASRATLPWLISAKSQTALRAQAARLATHLSNHPHLDAADVGFSLATTRGALDHRAAV